MKKILLPLFVLIFSTVGFSQDKAAKKAALEEDKKAIKEDKKVLKDDAKILKEDDEALKKVGKDRQMMINRRVSNHINSQTYKIFVNLAITRVPMHKTFVPLHLVTAHVVFQFVILLNCL